MSLKQNTASFPNDYYCFRKLSITKNTYAIIGNKIYKLSLHETNKARIRYNMWRILFHSTPFVNKTFKYSRKQQDIHSTTFNRR